jgi:signal transduction histidine kinase/CheY-like chemotaxis protein
MFVAAIGQKEGSWREEIPPKKPFQKIFHFGATPPRSAGRAIPEREAVVPTILIVDDNPVNRSFLATLLRYASYRLLEAADGAEALELTHKARPELVIADVLMPTMDGYEFVRQLRADPAVGHTAVIFYTAAYLEHEALALARACGVAYILAKPSAPQEILETVAAALGQPQAMPAPRVPAPSDETFDREHVRLLTNKLALKVDELQAVNGRLGALLELSRRLAAEHDPGSLVQICCDAAREIIGAQYAAIDIQPDDLQPLRYFRTSGIDGAAQLGDAPSGRGLLGRLLAEGRSMRVRDIAATPMRSFLGAPIVLNGHAYGILYLAEKLGADEFSADDEQIAVTLAAQLAVAYANAQLFAQVSAGNERLRTMSQQLVETQENERRAIARELHDEVGQSLTAALLNLQALADLPQSEPFPARIDDSMALIDRVLQQIRTMSLDLRPVLLDDLGLAPALSWLLDRQAERAGFVAEFRAEQADGRFPAAIESTCFRVLQEALTNVVRHARATRVSVTLRRQGAALQLHIRDDGIGFDVGAARERATRGQSLGLLGMQERIGLLGGLMQIVSSPADGTSIDVWLPLAPAGPDAVPA